jgi:hypothetical protein
MTKSICYLSHDFSKTELPPEVIKCPEFLLNGEQIRSWVSNLKLEPKVFATTSLYLLRELYIQEVPVTFVNYSVNGVFESDDSSSISNIEILDRDLEQGERYMDKEFQVQK